MNKFEIIERVLEDIKLMDISDIISKYVALDKRGPSYYGLCPFHTDESVGSFVVTPNIETFKCFSCDIGGDVITFIQEYFGVTFSEAVVLLGQDYGLITPKEYDDHFSGSKKVKRRKAKYTPKPKKEVSKTVEKLGSSALDKIYNILLGQLKLSKEHRDHLVNVRKLSCSSIKLGKYKSLSENINRDELVNKVIDILTKLGYSSDVLIGVPGFYKESGKWKMDNAVGLAIPIKNHLEEIIGIQIRRDTKVNNGPRYVWFSSSFATSVERKQEYGCSSGQPLDVIYPKDRRPRRQLFITEGRFKSEILANKWGYITISVQGVTNWRGISRFIEQIEETIGFKFDIVYTAFDADTNIKYQVFEQQKKMTDSIVEHFGETKSVKYLNWNHNKGKGIDDLILNNNVKEDKLIEIMSKNIVDKKYDEEYGKVIKIKTDMDERELRAIALKETFAV